MILQIQAYLTLLAQVGLAIYFLVWILARLLKIISANKLLTLSDNLLRTAALPIAFFISAFATVNSLYLSEIQGLSPCILCWYQRTLMYPQPVILAAALVLNDRKIFRYIFPLSVMGMIIAGYHYYLQMGGSAIVPCAAGIDCSDATISFFGYLTIPIMSMTAFVLTSFFSYHGLSRSNGGDMNG